MSGFERLSAVRHSHWTRSFGHAPLAAALLVAACSEGEGADNRPAGERSGESAAAAPAPPPAAGGWEIQTGGEGVALALMSPERAPLIRLFCPGGGREIHVNVPAFRPIGSEERLSLGSNGKAVALVADTSGDDQRGGVSATGAVPPDLTQLISGKVWASYGAQTSGPHPPPPAKAVRAFAAACGDPEQPKTAAADPDIVSACRKQEGEVIPPNALKAVGTEPFWAARIHGRCVTYMTPENQSGTRIWTQFTGSRDSGVWTGYYKDQRFVLRTRRAPGCSDGMSDKRYPVGVTLVVGGQERIGCAEWL